MRWIFIDPLGSFSDLGAKAYLPVLAAAVLVALVAPGNVTGTFAMSSSPPNHPYLAGFLLLQWPFALGIGPFMRLNFTRVEVPEENPSLGSSIFKNLAALMVYASWAWAATSLAAMTTTAMFG